MTGCHGDLSNHAVSRLGLAALDSSDGARGNADEGAKVACAEVTGGAGSAELGPGARFGGLLRGVHRPDNDRLTDAIQTPDPLQLQHV